MNDREKYLFDLRGYLVVENALTADQVKDLSDRLQVKYEENPKRIYGSDRTVVQDRAWTSNTLLDWGGTYIDLIDLPTIRPYLEVLLGINYRLDHDYIKMTSQQNSNRLYLHGGGQGAGGPRDLVGPSDGGQCFYRYNNGRFYNGLVAVAFELNTVTPGDGGFACVPGSHKSNFPLPTGTRESESQDEIPDWVDRVAASSGDAIIFTEACAHGTVPWRGVGKDRRTVFYKYCPHAVAWSPCYYNADHFEGLTDQQRAILMPPSAWSSNERTKTVWERAQEEQAELVQLRK